MGSQRTEGGKTIGMKKPKNLGIAFYYVIVEKRKSGLGSPTIQELGPYSTLKRAEDVKMEQEEARGEEGIEYTYRIDVRPNLFSK